MQLVLVGVGVVVVIVVALLLFGGGGKKAAKPRSRAASAERDSTGSRRTSRARSARGARSSRGDRRERRREERLQRRQETRTSGGRTTRSSSGGYTGGGSRAAVSPNQLRAILTDNAGSRLALVGERRLKAGDDVEGRRIVEVSSEGVKVEYRQNTYTVRVGQKLY